MFFISVHVAIKTWVYFDDLFKLNFFNAHLFLKYMLNASFMNSKRHIHNVIPSLILWFLWLEMNNSLLNDVWMNHHKVI
ncbi:hypothetical protein KFK09_008700 [Dendrobium nobile]|uniref:Uncharacterized protein n=1 Tax=Dendrobium nobile TaxID=94219 RepID=A0A8T3BNI8_DENNO|nr:hypothetical protein KFK09_008700 [Dendrobium nobile]